MNGESEVKDVKNKLYLAPEIYKKASGFTMATDWWAVGVIIYELVLGYKPFRYNRDIEKEEVKFPSTIRIPNSDNFQDLV